MLKRLVIILVLALLFSNSGPGVHSIQATNDFVPGEILVKFKPGTPARDIDQAHRQNGGQVKETIPQIQVQVVAVPAGREADRVAAYRRNPNVLFAEVNGFYHVITHGTTDTQVGKQWQYNNTGQTGGTTDADIDAFEAWHVTAGSSAVAVAILDTGIDQSHEDLAAKIAKNINFTDSNTVDDKYGHGTHVAGSAAAITNNSLGVAGTCPNCSLYNVKVLNDNGSGAWSWIANGIVWAADNGAKAVNMSLGGSSGSSTVESAVNYAWSNGVVVVASAGNDGSSDPKYPAFYTNVIAVAATDHNDAKPSWSNYGSWVDVAAPGASILSTAPDHPNRIWGKGPKYGTISGTSMAAPHVTGVAGLVWSTSLCGATNNTCVRSQIETKADPITGTGSLWAYGRINANNSVTPTNSPPTVSITDPAAGQTVAGTYRVKVSASDTDGSISKVELSIDSGAFIDITSNFDSLSNVYYYDWNTTLVTDGSHKLDARATDNGGAVSNAASVTVAVDNVDGPPTATTVNPANGAAVKGVVTIQVSASDDKGVSSVEYSIDSGVYAAITYNSTSGYWEASWDTTAYVDGSTHTIDARATDTAGQVGQAARVTVTVDNTAPVLSNIAATNVTSSSADITWTTDEAADSKVEYGTTSGSYTSSVSNGTLVTSHTVSLTGLTASTVYYYRVKSRDAAGNEAVSAEQSFTTTAPVGDPNEMGVFQITWESGKHLTFTVNVRRDSDSSGGLTSGDSPVAKATVTAVLTHDTNGNGLFECGAGDNCWTLSGDTNDTGDRWFKLLNAPTGGYKAEVTGLTHATYTWNKGLDLDNPDFFTR